MSAPILVDKYCRTFIAVALADGLDLDTVFKDNPFLAGEISSNKKLFGPAELSEITRKIKRSMDDEFFGFSQRKSCVGTLALAIELVLPSRHLREALDKIFNFYEKVHSERHLIFKPSMTASRICIQLSGEGCEERDYLTEWFLAYWRFLSGWLVGRTIPPSTTRFEHCRSGPLEEYEKVFGGKCIFGEKENSFSIDNRFLDLPIVASIDDLMSLYTISRIDLVSNFGIEDTLTQKLRAFLRCALLEFNRVSSIEEVAVKYHMSVAALRRKLKDEGTSYRAIKEDVRRDIAIDSLRTETLPISEVATRCGFTEMGSFCRAMKEWTGRTPSNYRETFLKSR